MYSVLYPRNKMAPSKPVRSLTDLSIKQLTNQIVTVCKANPGGDSANLTTLKNALQYLPGVLADTLVDKLINNLIDKRDRTLNPLFAAFRCLPLNSITKLDFRRAFMGYRLSRDLNVAFKSFCAEILVKTDRLTELVLIAKCTDAILKCLADNCHQLVHLNVAISDGITDEGVQVLCPASESSNKSHLGCYNLKIFNLKDCYISPPAIAKLVINLPKLRRVYYTNMASVVQELRKSPQDTFCLDYFEFYSSENESFDLCTVPETLPELTTLKLLVKDHHMNKLTEYKGCLQQIELELSSETGPGCANFFRSLCASNLTNISLQMTSFPADCILAIASNCSKLNTFKFVASTLENEEKLVPSTKYFQCLKEFIFSLLFSYVI